MNGHLCRCGTYPRILTAIQKAAAVMAKGGEVTMTGFCTRRSSPASRSSRAAARWSSGSRRRRRRPRGQGVRGGSDPGGLPARHQPARLVDHDQRRQHRDAEDEPDRDRQRHHDRLPAGARRRARHGHVADALRPSMYDSAGMRHTASTRGSSRRARAARAARTRCRARARRSATSACSPAQRCSAWPRRSSACRSRSLTVDKGVVSGGGKTVKYGELIGGKLFNVTRRQRRRCSRASRRRSRCRPTRRCSRTRTRSSASTSRTR